MLKEIQIVEASSMRFHRKTETVWNWMSNYPNNVFAYTLGDFYMD